MTNYSKFTEGLTVNNCNCRLSCLYKERDKLSGKINELTSKGREVNGLKDLYIQINEVIEELCKFRSLHPNCLLEGDPGYCI